MDWAPTASPYRAFNTHGQRQTLKFGEAPTEPKKGPFWYRVPPAPITPAQRVFNPPNQPRMRRSPASTSSQPEIVFRGPRKTRDRLDDRRGDEEENGGDERHKVAFAEPSFFSQPERNDPRNSLTDMFGQNLRLSQEQQEERSRHSWLGSSLLGLVSGNKAKE